MASGHRTVAKGKAMHSRMGVRVEGEAVEMGREAGWVFF